MSVYGERIARVEEQVSELKDAIKETNRRIDKMDKKLDELLELRNKGAGVIWLLSGAGMTGILAILAQVFHWLGGK